MEKTSKFGCYSSVSAASARAAETGTRRLAKIVAAKGWEAGRVEGQTNEGPADR